MLKPIVVIFTSILFLTSFGQTKNDLTGKWQLQYSLQPNNKPCNLPKDTTTINFYSNGNYIWTINGDSIIGKWKTDLNKIKFYDSKPINFNGTEGDVVYTFELKSDILIIHLPKGGDISCPDEYYKKKSG